MDPQSAHFRGGLDQDYAVTSFSLPLHSRQRPRTNALDTSRTLLSRRGLSHGPTLNRLEGSADKDYEYVWLGSEGGVIRVSCGIATLNGKRKEFLGGTQRSVLARLVHPILMITTVPPRRYPISSIHQHAQKGIRRRSDIDG